MRARRKRGKWIGSEGELNRSATLLVDVRSADERARLDSVYKDRNAGDFDPRRGDIDEVARESQPATKMDECALAGNGDLGKSWRSPVPRVAL